MVKQSSEGARVQIVLDPNITEGSSERNRQGGLGESKCLHI